MELGENMENKYASKNTLNRLPFYMEYLKKIRAEGERYISSTFIAKKLNLNDVQVRKDLALVSSSGGKPKVGYEIDELILDIETFLGFKNNNKAILIGVGSLGRALLNYNGFESYGLSIVKAFDVSLQKIGKRVNGIEILPIDDIIAFCKSKSIHIGIITVPREQAQEVCDILVKAGVKAIWNFAPAKLSVPEDILIQNENMASSLAVLSRHLNIKMK